MLSVYGQCTRQLEVSQVLFSRRIELGAKKIILILRILENTISTGKNKHTKKPQEFAGKFIEKHMKRHETKIPSTSYERRQELFLHDPKATPR